MNDAILIAIALTLAGMLAIFLGLRRNPLGRVLREHDQAERLRASGTGDARRPRRAAGRAEPARPPQPRLATPRHPATPPPGPGLRMRLQGQALRRRRGTPRRRGDGNQPGGHHPMTDTSYRRKYGSGHTYVLDGGIPQRRHHHDEGPRPARARNFTGYTAGHAVDNWDRLRRTRRPPGSRRSRTRTKARSRAPPSAAPPSTSWPRRWPRASRSTSRTTCAATSRLASGSSTPTTSRSP